MNQQNRKMKGMVTLCEFSCCRRCRVKMLWRGFLSGFVLLFEEKVDQSIWRWHVWNQSPGLVWLTAPESYDLFCLAALSTERALNRYQCYQWWKLNDEDSHRSVAEACFQCLSRVVLGIPTSTAQRVKVWKQGKVKSSGLSEMKV